jgi:hypothetical protein
VLLRCCELAGVVLDSVQITQLDLVNSNVELKPQWITSFKTQVKMMRFDTAKFDVARTFEESEAFYKSAIAKAKVERGTNDVQTIK